MADETPLIDCRWEINEDKCRAAVAKDLKDALEDLDLGTPAIEAWFKQELSAALRVLIVEEGAASISFADDSTPEIRFYADRAQIEELTYAEPLAAELYDVIDNWGGDIDDDQAGPKLRRDLIQLREVLRRALDKIDATLGDETALYGSPRGC